MTDDGALDLDALRRLVDWHIAEGTDGIVIVGTTGESPTVSFDEHCLLIRTTVEQAAGRVPVIAGTGANSTTEAIELTDAPSARARRPGCRWCRTTTSRPRKASTSTTRRSPKRSTCR
jgi:4-hydroxy-tetrahydrodipicolinate synthase